MSKNENEAPNIDKEHGPSYGAAEVEVLKRDREEEALCTVKRYMWLSMGAGLVPIPFLDIAVVSGVQLKMIAALSKIYDVPFKRNRGKAAAAALAGFMVPHTLACGFIGSLIKAIPVVGLLAGGPAMAAFSGASAWALGKVFIQHFESGGTLLTFDPENVKEYNRSQFEEGNRVAATMKTAST